MLSVCVVTYNQEQFIRQCLQSLVSQRVDFKFQIIVSDDCSTDRTSNIVAEFAESYPEIVHHIRHKQNLGAYRNYQFVHSFARDQRGAYIAHVDGDDYVLPGKLAAQVAVLAGNAAVALSTHAVKVECQDRLIGAAEHLPEFGGLNDLLAIGPYFVNSSTMYRSANAFAHDDTLEMIDFYMYIEQASRGAIHLIKTPLGVYRWHDAGISKSELHRQRIERGYEVSYSRALQLGASDNLVKRARLARRASLAVARLIAGDVKGFRLGITLEPGDFRYATFRHLLLIAARFLIPSPLMMTLIRKLVPR